MIFTVKAYAVDWCGYESCYEIEADSAEDAKTEAIEHLISEYDLLLHEDGMYGEMDDFDEDGAPLDDVELTSICASIEDDE